MNTPNVIVMSYHFPHYRGPALDAIKNTGASVKYAGQLTDPYDIGVEPWAINDSHNFVPLESKQLIKGRPFLWQRGALSFIRHNKCDVLIIYGHVYVISAWVLAIYCKFKKIPCFNWTHGWRKKEYGIRRVIRKAFFKLFTGLIVFSDQAKKIGVSEGLHPDDIYVVYNSLNVPLQDEIYHQLTQSKNRQDELKLFDNSDPIVACIGRLTPEREVNLLIDSCKLLRENGNPVNLLLVGEGPELNALKEYATLSNVTALFTGAVYDEKEIAKYLLSSSVTVSPGSIGLLVMHSLIYGVPVISHDEESSQKPEWHAIEPGVNGDYFVKGNADSLARKIQEWVSDKPDRDSIAQKCRETVLSYYNPAYQSTIFENVINNSVNST